MPSNSSLLRTFLDVGKSPIHGTGLFAKKDIKNGTLLGEFTGRVVQNPRDEMHAVWRADGLYLQAANRLKYLNHADDPNAELAFDPETEAVEVYSISDIVAGAEVTVNYG
jgi:uncharacterized protein